MAINLYSPPALPNADTKYNRVPVPKDDAGSSVWAGAADEQAKIMKHYRLMTRKWFWGKTPSEAEDRHFQWLAENERALRAGAERAKERELAVSGRGLPAEDTRQVVPRAATRATARRTTRR